jgi:hypothetical protein
MPEINYKESVVDDVLPVDELQMKQIDENKSVVNANLTEPHKAAIPVKEHEDESGGESPKRRKSETVTSSESKASPSRSVQVNPNRVKGIKAKEKRLERKRQKLIARGIDPATVIVPRKQPEPKGLDDFFIQVPDAKIQLRLNLLKTNSPEFQGMIAVEHRLYQRYQMCIHGEKEDDCTLKQFTRFLCDNPLNVWHFTIYTSELVLSWSRCRDKSEYLLTSSLFFLFLGLHR